MDELLKKITPLPWRVRFHPELGSFVEGKRHGKAYGQQILGDDYEGASEQEENDPVYVAHAANVLPEVRRCISDMFRDALKYPQLSLHDSQVDILKRILNQIDQVNPLDQ